MKEGYLGGEGETPGVESISRRRGRRLQSRGRHVSPRMEAGDAWAVDAAPRTRTRCILPPHLNLRQLFLSLSDRMETLRSFVRDLYPRTPLPLEFPEGHTAKL